MRYAFVGLVRKLPGYSDPTAIAASAREWNRLMTLLDAQLERTQAYVLGAELTLADIVLGCPRTAGSPPPSKGRVLAAVEAYYARLSARPGFLRDVP